MTGEEARVLVPSGAPRFWKVPEGGRKREVARPITIDGSVAGTCLAVPFQLQADLKERMPIKGHFLYPDFWGQFSSQNLLRENFWTTFDY